MRQTEIITSYHVGFPNVVGYSVKNQNVTSKAVVLIVHGMAEHVERYNDMASFFANNGFVTYAFDLIGHGKSCFENEKVGIIKSDDFFDSCIECMNQIYEYIRRTNKDLPIYLFAHSMGSMISQSYLQKFPNQFDKVILSGTDLGGVKYELLKLLAKTYMKKHGKYSYSKFINKLTLDSFDLKFKSKLSWLSVNKDNIDKYLNDPLCNEKYPVGYFYSLALHLCQSCKDENIKKIRLNKILFITGVDDPVTNFSKSTKAIYKKYLKNNINAFIEIIPNARHEFFHEDDESNLKAFNKLVDFYIN